MGLKSGLDLKLRLISKLQKKYKERLEIITMFSREKQKTQALGMLIRHAKQLAINQDAEFRIKHSDEAKEAQNKNFTKLQARITKEFNDNYAKITQYREKHWK